ncbi:MAG: hypothetical protein GW808_05225 [Sphingomonadales bacterium]|nr:hypothetical protein [Sphingomonadales bacterium]NCO49956.1 hypothetical protein [Sphingomonadales bacterium]NCP00414.1 hypothetical protein [Sphingomonadales bacterium]NCP26794.1 hypothetical protein [Sphingomonadales bacterium]NCP43436.1 hypothetical protein [Sphingomonadales bacterium]
MPKQHNKQNILIAIGAVLSGLLVLPASANATLTEPPASDEDIIVTGTKTTKTAIADFIETTIATPKGGRHQGQYARFADPVCPKVTGLSKTNIEQVEQRMRGVALAADMAVAAEGCKPNIFVMVVADGNEAISLLRKKNSRVFGALSLPERARIAESGGPAYAWKRIQEASAETGALFNSDDAVVLPGDSLGKTEVATLTSNVKSRIKRTVQQSMTHSFLLLEQDALVNLTTVQIADYAAMRSYIDTRDSGTESPPAYSILALFEDKSANAPESASEMDLVLLSSLYNSPSDVSALMQSSAMLHRIKQELTTEQND